MNLELVLPVDAVAPLTRAVVAAAALTAVLALPFRDIRRGAIVASAIVVAFFGFGHVAGFIAGWGLTDAAQLGGWGIAVIAAFVVAARAKARLPQLTFAKEVTVGDGTVAIKRLTDDGYTAVEASLPAIVSVVEKINEPRYPSFKGIMAAKKKPVETLSLSDLGIDAGDVGLGGAWSTVESFEAAPPRQAGTVVKDEGGDGADKLVDFLASKKFV